MTEIKRLDESQLIGARRLNLHLKENSQGFTENRRKLIDETKKNLAARAKELAELGLFPRVLISRESMWPTETGYDFDAIDLGLDIQKNVNVLLRENGHLEYARLIQRRLDGVTIDSRSDRYSRLVEFPEDEMYEKHANKAFSEMQKIVQEALPQTALPTQS